MIKVFISHCSEDGGIIAALAELWKECGEEIKLFYSSDPETGIPAGDSLLRRISGEIEQCGFFVPVLTENYARSLYCVYELSAAVCRQSCRIVPICSSAAQFDALQNILAASDLRYIDAGSPDAAAVMLESFPWMKRAKSEALLARTASFLEALAGSPPSRRPFIGMTREAYDRLPGYCASHGIDSVRDVPLPPETIKARLRGAKRITLFTTTGAGLLKVISADAMTDALVRGAVIRVILPNPYSGFCEDVAAIEQDGDPLAQEANLKRLNSEYEAVVGFLQETVKAAAERAGGRPIGQAACFCGYTLLRQTVFLVEYADGASWGWISLTTPPLRTANRSLLLELHGTGVSGETAELLRRHCDAAARLAEKRGHWFPVRGDGAVRPFFLEKTTAKRYWEERYREASETMAKRRGLSETALIEVAAQHPLRRNGTPGVEFAARLDAAAELREKLLRRGREADIYIPGSRHRDGDREDVCTLSEAGRRYLLEKGIPENHLLGDEKNRAFKGDDGVYNSADECFVASRIFLEGDYEALYCVCSPNQVARKTLFYLEFGVLPLCCSVPAEQMYHSMIRELLDTVDGVLYGDHSWQDPASQAFRETRAQRVPKTKLPGER